jgi:hypothetical protein
MKNRSADVVFHSAFSIHHSSFPRCFLPNVGCRGIEKSGIKGSDRHLPASGFDNRACKLKALTPARLIMQ